ncbi:sensor domain-containing diguanylate cyclase [Deinococcus sp.]|uniref:sensor domain-containing diguanylate cyclase n=1 Tax=Deinococcus sp. TaxID=47478 RepID=UPI003C7D5C38
MNQAERELETALAVEPVPGPGDASALLSEHSPELRRLAALARYRLEPNTALGGQVFERLVGLASRLFSVPTALISFVGEGWQWWGASCGLAAAGLAGFGGLPVSQSLCDPVVHSGQARYIADTTQNADSLDHPMVTQGGVRFHASAPLTTPDGHTIGTLCLIDTRPHAPLTQGQRQTLDDLAQLVMDELEFRLLATEHERQASASERLAESLREALAQSETLQAVSALSDLDLSTDDLFFQAVAHCASVCDVDLGALVAIHGDRAFVFPAWNSARAAGLAQRVSRGLKSSECELLWTVARTGAAQPVFANDYGSHPGAHLAMAQAGVKAQTYAPLGTRGEVRFVMVLSRLHHDRPWRPHQRQLISAVARMTRDVSLKRQAQEALAGSAAQLDLALGSAPLVLFSVDQDGVFRLMRGSSEQIGGWHSLVGKRVDDAFEAIPQLLNNIHRAMSGEEFDDLVQFAGRTYDVRYLHARDAQGRPAGMLGLGYNVSRLAQSEQRALVAQQKAEALLALAQAVNEDVLDPAVADVALGTLLRVLSGGWLVLWQLRGERYYPVSQRGEGSELSSSALEDLHRFHAHGIPKQSYARLFGAADRNVYLATTELHQRDRQAGIQGMASLPLLVQRGECQVALAAYSHRPWNPTERELLETAASLFGAGLERRQRLTQLEHDAGTDALTGLGNRRTLNQALVRSLEHADAQDSGLSVVSIDLDGLKTVNDLHGHAEGDALLSQFAADVQDALPAGGRLFRLGGDEFVAVYPLPAPAVGESGRPSPDHTEPNHTEPNHTEPERRGLDWLCSAVESTRRSGFAAASASAGEARFPHDSSSAPELLRLSDERMYAEKERRRPQRS